ncbi:RNA 2',3'-cyclic phosphodiesterase [Alcanivorax sp. S6407]|uniref:RNA 2',3'-cyclic phosphodiesterase n=1 Tax=Alcanivorax sp. S6407 TaxID=2926424 RepID=UPI001FF16F2A|nr:RNA 2',3'-cyclic phosphodiesterase [Alcanivorax sp. S6407]MCK0152592.1 RNA 2',3'-cyclic phosphodiesterase [Alcanivorax sp. S6407]
MRCFIGVPVTGDLANDCVTLASGYPGAAPVANLHMTLSFLGECSAELIRALHEPLDTLASSFSPFTVTLPRCEPFPGQNGPFLALTGQSPAPLQVLQQNMTEQLLRLGIKLEDRPFRPHITLAKPRASVPALTGSWALPVRGFWLYQSQPGDDGRPIYTSLARFPFFCP